MIKKILMNLFVFSIFFLYILKDKSKWIYEIIYESIHELKNKYT